MGFQPVGEAEGLSPWDVRAVSGVADMSGRDGGR